MAATDIYPMDTTVLGGISSIINKQNVDPTVNYEEIEKNMISGGFFNSHDETDPSNEFKNELNALSEKLGIPLDDIMNNHDRNSNEMDLLTTKSSVSINDFVNGDDNDREDHRDDVNRYSDDRHDNHQDNRYGGQLQLHSSSQLPTTTSDYTTNYGRNNEFYMKPNSQQDVESDDDEPTDEEERRSVTQGVISTMTSESSSKIFSLEKEKREHERGIKLEKIDELRKTLESERVDLTNVPIVKSTSSDEEIDYSLKILVLKNDRIRFHTVAEEVILLGAYALEEIFDGKREWLGGYKPDLVGWHTHVNSKLRRMRYDTSTLVSNIMSEYNIGSIGRILLELVPNAFMYSRKKKKGKESDTLYSQERAKVERTNIRDKNELF